MHDTEFVLSRPPACRAAGRAMQLLFAIEMRNVVALVSLSDAHHGYQFHFQAPRLY